MSLFRRKPEPIGKALQDYFDSVKDKTKLKRGLAMSNWNEIVGVRIAEQTREIKTDGAKLIVFMKNSLWRSEVHAQRYTILNKLNQSVGDDVFSEIVVKE
ncbi:DUF721 domain-containing protein [bacterium]|nr:MAG: DUF721 domain-containing protein [bacterium]